MVKKENRAYFYAVGKRKTARATVKLFSEGSGEIEINGKTLKEWSDDDRIFNNVIKPLSVLGSKKEYDVVIKTSGGGKVAQSESVLLGISRALVKQNPEFRLQLKQAGLLSRDARKKERMKPGLKKARRAPQFSKR